MRNVGQTEQFPEEISRSSGSDTQDYTENAETITPITPKRAVQLGVEGLYLVTISRTPSEVHLRLKEGPYLKLCLERLAAEGHAAELESGTKIFCEPKQYAETRVAMAHLDFVLRPSHVVATEKYLSSVLHTLENITYQKPCGKTKRTRIMYVKVKSTRLFAYIARSDADALANGKLYATRRRRVVLVGVPS